MKSDDKESVTISAPPAAPVTIDPHNPLPEPSFLWRRLFAAAIAFNAGVFAWFAAAWLVGGQQWMMLYGLTKLVIYGAGVVVTYYFVAPSAAELTQIIQSASIIRNSLRLGAESAVGRAESRVEERFRRPASPDSQIPASVADGPPSGCDDDSGDDVAPRASS